MSIEFDEQNNSRFSVQPAFRDFPVEKRPLSFSSFLVKHHIIKNERTAKIILLIIALLVLILSIWGIVNSFNGPVFIDRV